MIPGIDKKFPAFASLISEADVEEVQPLLSDQEIAKKEEILGLLLPDSYKAFLKITNGFWLFGGAIQFSLGHPFFHNFQPIESLSPQQKRAIEIKGVNWPPPSNGILCFAEYFLEADGDQVLFNVDDSHSSGEYPVYYYSHESNSPSVKRVADSFIDWLELHCIQDMKGGY